MNTVQAGRLLTLAYYLKTEVPPDKFDMSIWGYKKVSATIPLIDNLSEGLGNSLDSSGKPVSIKAKVMCKTSACALGWATVVFPEHFRMTFDNNLRDIAGAIQASMVYDGYVECFEGLVEIKKNGKWHSWEYEDLMCFFGVSEEDIGDIFYGPNCTPKEKAKQIEALVVNYGYTYK